MHFTRLTRRTAAVLAMAAALAALTLVLSGEQP